MSRNATAAGVRGATASLVESSEERTCASSPRTTPAPDDTAFVARSSNKSTSAKVTLTPAAANGYSHALLVPFFFCRSESYVSRLFFASHTRFCRLNRPPLRKSVAGSTPCHPMDFHPSCFRLSDPSGSRGSASSRSGKVNDHSSRSCLAWSTFVASYGTSTRRASRARRSFCASVSGGGVRWHKPSEANSLRKNSWSAPSRSKGGDASSSAPADGSRGASALSASSDSRGWLRVSSSPPAGLRRRIAPGKILGTCRFRTATNFHEANEMAFSRRGDVVVRSTAREDGEDGGDRGGLRWEETRRDRDSSRCGYESLRRARERYRRHPSSRRRRGPTRGTHEHHGCVLRKPSRNAGVQGHHEVARRELPPARRARLDLGGAEPWRVAVHLGGPIQRRARVLQPLRSARRPRKPRRVSQGKAVRGTRPALRQNKNAPTNDD